MNIPSPVVKIIKRLHSSGFQAYVVGGAVRDVCLGRVVTDWDVATSALPGEIRAVFRDQRHFSLKHETVTIVDSGRKYEITTFRGSGCPEMSIEIDLMHRDFTINAMAYDMDKGEIIDPNEGLKDIAQKVVRAAGRPDDRFQEDPLRMLRAVRISSELGFKIHEKTFESICRMAPDLSSVAAERIRDELMRILLLPVPSGAFRLARRSGILKEIIPELIEGFRMTQNRHHRFTIYRHIMETVDMVEAEPALRLAALLHDIAKPRVRKKVDGVFRFFGHEKESAVLAGEILARLKFSNEIINNVTGLVESHMVQYEPHWSDGAVRRFVRKAGSGNIDSLLLFRKADLIAHGISDHKLDHLEELRKRIGGLKREDFISSPHDLAIGGDDVINILGISPGPEVGRIMNLLMEKVTDDPALNTGPALAAVLERMRRQMGNPG